MINWPVYEQLELHLVMMDVLAVGLQRDEQCGRGSPPLLWFVFSSSLDESVRLVPNHRGAGGTGTPPPVSHHKSS